jgi:hypothetical protein
MEVMGPKDGLALDDEWLPQFPSGWPKAVAAKQHRNWTRLEETFNRETMQQGQLSEWAS